MVDVKFPKRADEADSLSSALKPEAPVTFIEPDVSGRSDQVVPAEVVGRDQGPRIWEIAPRKNSNCFFPIWRGSAGRERNKTNG
jgi:hypothetical protein